LYEASDAEYLIYTNVDIALMPTFYTSVAALIESGVDAFIINRRTIPSHYRFIEQLPCMYAEAGEKHPGYDCFIFRRESFANFRLGKVCIGVPKIGIVLAANMVCYSEKFREYRDLHLTFHIGDEGGWTGRGADEYFLYNRQESEKVLNDLAPEFNKPELPDVGLPALAAYFRWLMTGRPAAP
jgi:hypothetical protein